MLNSVAAELAAGLKVQKCDCKAGCLIEVWQQNWLLVELVWQQNWLLGSKDVMVRQQNWLLVGKVQRCDGRTGS